MFKFATETIINSNVDSSGSTRFVGDTKSFTIKRLGTFLKDNVSVIYHTAHQDSAKSKVTVDLSGLTAGDIYRVHIYVKLSGSNNSFFSNDLVFKGKPFDIEFIAGTGNATTVANLVSKYKIADNDYEMLVIKADSADVLSIEGNDQYMLLTKVDIEHFVESAGTTGEFEVVGGMGNGTKVTVVTTAKEGLGNPEQLMKNLRLPTAANTRWNHIGSDEDINKDGKYDQYVLYYTVDRGMMGGQVIGEKVTSITQHTFWVESAVKSAFDTAIKAMGAKYIDTTGDSDVINEVGDIDGNGGTAVTMDDSVI